MPQIKKDTFVVDTICSWLSNRPSETPAGDTQAIIDGILHKFGHIEPYTPEQRAINAMLLINDADELTCQVAWEFYHDYNDAPSEQSKSIAA